MKTYVLLICTAITFISTALFSTLTKSHDLHAAGTIICVNGGIGSSGCSIGAGIEIFGVGLSGDCSVDCQDGYYSCCAVTCRCFPNGTPCLMIPVKGTDKDTKPTT